MKRQPSRTRGLRSDESPGRRPDLVVLAGLPGTGKSTLAEPLASRIGAVWLRVDTLEAAILTAGIPRSQETGLAAYLGVRDQAREQLRSGRSVVVDAVNGVEEARAMWRELQEEFSLPHLVVELVCSDAAAHRDRVESRPSPTPPLPKPTWSEVVHREYHPWRESILTVDTVKPLERNLRRVLAYIASRRSQFPAGKSDASQVIWVARPRVSRSRLRPTD